MKDRRRHPYGAVFFAASPASAARAEKETAFAHAAQREIFKRLVGVCW